MNKITTIMVIYALVLAHAFAADEFSMTFNTAQVGGSYAPKNIVAVWVTKSDGTFVKTIMRWAGTRKGDLLVWKVAAGGTSDSDGVMGATRPNHSAPSPVTAMWDMKDRSGNVVPDGTYEIYFEVADTWRRHHNFSFIKDGVAGTRTDSGTSYFTDISIAYAPPAPANTAPVAGGQSVSTAEDAAKLVVLTAIDTEGDSLAYLIESNPSHGSLSGTSSNITYTPATNYYGADSFAFSAYDGTVTGNTATISINVTSVNDAPVAQPQSPSAVDGNALSITLSATDAETNAITYHLLSQPLTGHLLGTVPSLTYLPPKGVNGYESITFNTDDGSVTGNTAIISINISFTDTDGDGIPNSWENSHGMTNGANDRLVDSDEDGASNYAEYMAGTDAGNPNSRFALGTPQMSGGSNVILQWSSVQDHYYTVQSTTNLSAGWSILLSNSVATPPLNSYTGAVDQTDSQYYQIRLEP